MTFRTTVERFGKSVGLRVPEHVAKELGLRPGQWVTADLRTAPAVPPPPKGKRVKAKTLRRRAVSAR